MNDTAQPSSLTSAIDRSSELAMLIQAAWESTPAITDPRRASAQGLCAVSLQHGAGTRALLAPLPASAIALMRPQFESLVRAVWCIQAASDGQLARLLAPLSEKSQQAAKALPGVPEMLSALEAAGPPGAAALLGRARTRLNDGLNSFIHGGIHPFARERDGYPDGLLVDVLKNSNALAMITLIVLATLLENADVVALMRGLHQAFEDLLPELEPLAAVPWRPIEATPMATGTCGNFHQAQ
jgi:hypothetical protein